MLLTLYGMRRQITSHYGTSLFVVVRQRGVDAPTNRDLFIVMHWSKCAIAIFDGILPKRPYLSCVSMADMALLAGYHRIIAHILWSIRKIHQVNQNKLKMMISANQTTQSNAVLWDRCLNFMTNSCVWTVFMNNATFLVFKPEHFKVTLSSALLLMVFTCYNTVDVG